MPEWEFTHLLQTRPGIGVKATTRYGETVFFFYEDYPASPGISRAMSQTYNAMQKGTLIAATFIDNHGMLWKEICHKNKVFLSPGGINREAVV